MGTDLSTIAVTAVRHAIGHQHLNQDRPKGHCLGSLRLEIFQNATAYHFSMPNGVRRNPDWEWDELVLACDLVMQNGGRSLPAENPHVIELSELLQRMTLHPPEVRQADFRNPNGVGRKTADIATALPGYTGRPTNGGRRDKEVIARFLAEPDVMHSLAEAIRKSEAEGEPMDLPREVSYDNESEMEGRYLLRWHMYRERNPALRRKKINSVLVRGGTLTCEACGFDFGQTYGERGHGYIECHHVEPLHVGGEGPRTIRDLALLCSNCHRMVHTKLPWPTPAQLRDIIRAQADAERRLGAAMALRDIGRDQVLAAIAEYDRLGQEEFLRRHGFGRARSYLLIHAGKTYDSKAIVGAAHNFLPGNQPLAAGQFSGGEATVGRLLSRLGFTLQVFEDLSTGELVKQITSLTVDRSSGRPALYQPITLLWGIGRAYRGEPRMEGWEATQLHVLELLECYGHQGVRLRADYPVAALHRAGLWELDQSVGQVPNAHGDVELKRWFDAHQPRGGLVSPVYDLMRYSGEARVSAVRAILNTFFVNIDYVSLLEDVGLSDTAIATEAGAADDNLFSSSPLEEAYRRLCGIADLHRERASGRRAARRSGGLARSAAARRAVLMRSAGTCENPNCTGQARDLTDSGHPILEVDHIHDLALGGPDDPGQMIALCPNCHAIKTRGRTREQLRDLLFVTAKQRHEALLEAVQTESWLASCGHQILGHARPRISLQTAWLAAATPYQQLQHPDDAADLADHSQAERRK